MIEYLISILRQRDVVLRLENGRLVCDAPQGAMTPDLIEQVEYNKAEIVRFLQRTGERDPSKSIRRRAQAASNGAEIPLSFSQESLWFLEQLNPGNAAYNIPLKINIAAHVDHGSCDEASTRFCVVTKSYELSSVSCAGRRPRR